MTVQVIREYDKQLINLVYFNRTPISIQEWPHEFTFTPKKGGGFNLERDCWCRKCEDLFHEEINYNTLLGFHKFIKRFYGII